MSLRWLTHFNGNSPINSYLVQYQSDDFYNLDIDALIGQANISQLQQATTSVQQQLQQQAAVNQNAFEQLADDLDRTLVELNVNQSDTHLIIKDLQPNSVYRLRLAAMNKIGLGEFSDWIRAKTEEAPPSGPPNRIQASATGPNSIKVSWTVSGFCVFMID